MLGVLWWLLTHISPNSCLWQRFLLWVRNYISPQVTRSFSDSENHTSSGTFVFLLSGYLYIFVHILADFFSPPFVSCVAADIISTVEFNSSGELLATGDKGGRVVVFQREQEVGNANNVTLNVLPLKGSDLFLIFLFYIFALVSWMEINWLCSLKTQLWKHQFFNKNPLAHFSPLPLFICWIIILLILC